MDIKSKDGELYYLSCLICEGLKDIENLITENLVLRDKLLYDSRFQYLLSVRDKLIEKILETNCD